MDHPSPALRLAHAAREAGLSEQAESPERISSRSNSASAAKMPNTRWPAAVLVSSPGRSCWLREFVPPAVVDFIGRQLGLDGYELADYAAVASRIKRGRETSEKRRRLDELMNVLHRGDRLVVSELSRLGRSLGQIVAILDALAKAGVAFVALKENIRVEGKRDVQTKVMTTLFALFAEVERDLISERTREGLARAQGLGPQARAPEGLAGRFTPRWQGGRDPALHRAGRLQDRHRQDHRRLPDRASTAS